MTAKAKTIAEAIWPATGGGPLGCFAVLALRAAFGFRLAAATVGLFLAEGRRGLPVFAAAPAGASANRSLGRLPA
jgi:hypothetical protein